MREVPMPGFPGLVTQIVEKPSELPSMRGVKRLYLDVETNGLDPWNGDRICGIAVLRDEEKNPWYVPLRHTLGGNIEITEGVKEWMQDCMSQPEQFINHNPKFDAHFLHAEGVMIPRSLKMVCTLTLAKLVQSDRYYVDKWGDPHMKSHGLKQICQDWLDMPQQDEEEVLTFLGQYRKKVDKTYDRVPVRIMGKYAGGDVIRARGLFWHCMGLLTSDQRPTVDLEVAVTGVLYRMEERGLQVDTAYTAQQSMILLHRIHRTVEELEKLTGGAFHNSNNHMQRVIAYCGLPILSWKWKRERGKLIRGGPNFDKEAMELYLHRPELKENEKVRRIIQLVVEYRRAEQLQGLYASNFLKYSDKHGRIHPTYNQVVRTGRMSCTSPSVHQLNKWAKGLIVGDFLSADASQIEFRLISHYAYLTEVYAAYEKDPRADFHQVIADMLGITRKAAKALNFAIAYGAGKKKATQMVSREASIRAMVNESDPDAYEKACQAIAGRFLEAYHERFPGIKQASYAASRACRNNGYVRNFFGRRRHLGDVFAHKSFNACVQGMAMDLIKRNMVELDDIVGGYGVDLAANVHDELLFVGPGVGDPATHAAILAVLERPVAGLRVPIRWDMGFAMGPGATWQAAALASDSGGPGEITAWDQSPRLGASISAA